jgi:hypothetical protein
MVAVVTVCLWIIDVVSAITCLTYGHRRNVSIALDLAIKTTATFPTYWGATLFHHEWSMWGYISLSLASIVVNVAIRTVIMPVVGYASEAERSTPLAVSLAQQVKRVKGILLLKGSSDGPSDCPSCPIPCL